LLSVGFSICTTKEVWQRVLLATLLRIRSDPRNPCRARSASIDAARVREMKAQGLGATAIAEALGIGRASVYRVLEADGMAN